MSEAELKRNKKRRQANINVLCGLITKAKDIITAEDENIEKDRNHRSTESYSKKENSNRKFEGRNNKCYRRRFHRRRDR